MFGLFRKLQRRNLALRPFPPQWMLIVERRLPFFQPLTPELRQRFLKYLKIFAWEKYFIGAGGLVVTDEMKVMISASAVRLILFLDLSYYDRLTEIIVYPEAYLHPNSDVPVLGESQWWGTVVLSWEAVLRGIADQADGHDTALHEFAHVLDRADGAYDGTPQLRQLSHYRPWTEVMGQHFQNLRRGRPHERAVLSDYGAQNEAEFFAVATEVFFERPRAMRARTPALYEELQRFYGWDPAAQATSERTARGASRSSGVGEDG